MWHFGLNVRWFCLTRAKISGGFLAIGILTLTWSALTGAQADGRHQDRTSQETETREKVEIAEESLDNKWSVAQRKIIDSAIIEAMERTHDGWSSDEVILRDSLNSEFLAVCRSLMEGEDFSVRDDELNWRLLNLRKSGKLTIKAVRRETADYQAVMHFAEIAARMMEDKYSMSTDRIMVDPKLRAEFDQITSNVDDEIDPYLVRKAAFNLRKARQLRPELITRVADWQRTVEEFALKELAENLELVSTNPGVYIFRDRTGYLYIGEALNLRDRLKQHLNQSDRKALANYLQEAGFENMTVEVHAFDPNSRAKEVMVRRAYESELIQSRKPKFNIRP